MKQGALRERSGEHPLGDTSQLIILVVFALVWVSDSFVLHATTFLSSHVPNFLCYLVTVFLVAVAVYLSFTSHVVVRAERPSEVVESGGFKYVRHPLYLAAMLGYLAAAISSLSLASLALLIPIFVAYNYLATYEEKLLGIKFGERYQEYAKRTGKWLPRL